jgi:hypothetical protein
MNQDKLKAALEQLDIVNPHHITLTRSGHGEYPDAYKLTDNGIKALIKLIMECDEAKQQ